MLIPLDGSTLIKLKDTGTKMVIAAKKGGEEGRSLVKLFKRLGLPRLTIVDGTMLIVASPAPDARKMITYAYSDAKNMAHVEPYDVMLMLHNHYGVQTSIDRMPFYAERVSYRRYTANGKHKAAKAIARHWPRPWLSDPEEHSAEEVSKEWQKHFGVVCKRFLHEGPKGELHLITSAGVRQLYDTTFEEALTKMLNVRQKTLF